jgi:plasmid stabilization system protein ParE
LIYELSDEEIHILAVIHGRRLLESLERFND